MANFNRPTGIGQHFLSALTALILLALGNVALADCRAPAACISCHTAIGHPSAAVLTAMAPASCALGDFSRGLNMSMPRFIHRTAKLADGRVLMTGGETANAPSVVITNSVDIFNPVDSSVMAGGPMTVKRWSHTATTLNDGRVLVTGGRTGSTTANGVVLATAEIYDPVTNSWSETAGPMNVARRSQAATLLADGRVLISGGGNNPSTTVSLPITSAEIFDPATGLFTLVGNMTVARSSHSAILLGDGTVLIAGGSTGAGTSYPTTSAEIFNPVGNTFTAVGPMNFSHLAQLPGKLRDGRIVNGSSYYNVTHTASGGLITSESEIYTPGTQTFAPIEHMIKQRIDIGAMGLLDGTLLVAGGVTTSPSYPSIFQSASEVYDPSTGHWNVSGIMSTGRDEFSGLLLDDGRAMISGGFVSPGAVLLNTIEVYTPGLNPQVKGYQNVLNDTSLSAYKLGISSRMQLLTKLTSIGYAIGTYGGTPNLSEALRLASLMPGAIDLNLKPTATAEKARMKAINRVLVNTLTDKVSPNVAPTVAPAAVPGSGVEPLPVSFTGNAADSDGVIVNTLWTFGDGETSSAANPAHTYQCKGTYKPSLEVVDNRGAVGAGTTPVTVTSAGGPVTYRCDVQPVFSRVCTGCHGSAAGLSLTSCANLQAGETTGPVIFPGSKELSVLWQEISTGGMPAVGGMLPAADITAIGAWIDSLNPANPNFCP